MSQTKLCLPIIGPTYEEAKNQLHTAATKGELAELRLDLFERLDRFEILHLTKLSKLPLIIALRTQNQGGGFSGSEEERLLWLRWILSETMPNYLDIEWTTGEKEIQELYNQKKETLLIISHHDMTQTPKDLTSVWHNVSQFPADLYKIATFAKKTTDALRVLHLAKEINATSPKLCALTMGSFGEMSRVLSPLVGSPLTFAALDEEHQSASGQLPVDLLKNVYGYSRLSKKSHFLGLIGDPVEQSVSHIVHNHVLENLKIPASYVKMTIEKQSLSECIKTLRSLPFRGTSVTMPLKEVVIPLMDHLDGSAKRCGAVNTILSFNGKLEGHNTDGKGALNAISKHLENTLKGKQVLIVGAGGAAAAIASEALHRGCAVTILNRHPNRAENLANRIGCAWGRLENLPFSTYDILVQATSVGMVPNEDNSIIPTSCILPGSLVFDVISKPKMTKFLTEAKELGCKIVTGEEMLIEQAVLQMELWFPQETHGKKVQITNLMKQAAAQKCIH